jgi:hypothetical protein
MNESNQEVRGSKIDGKVTQTTDVSRATQKAENIEAKALDQKISSQQPSLRLGKYRAQGLYAVIGLVLLGLVYLAIRFFLKK